VILFALQKVSSPLLRILAFVLSHLEEALTFAGILTLASIAGTLASRLTLAGVYASALDFRVRSRDGAAREAGAEEDGGRRRERRAGSVYQSHGCNLHWVNELGV
jgi:hypothetical protein